MSTLRASRALPLACASLAAAGLWLTKAAAEERGQEKAHVTEKVTLQYRVARDAFAPSRFVAVVNGGISVPVELTWDLPNPGGKKQREAQARQRGQFDDLIKKLEAKVINGVEFECIAEWLVRGVKLRVTSVPQPTEAGKRRIQENER